MNKQSLDSVVLELMASRICHDLISPVGAVNNGVEFLQEDMGGDPAEAIELIAMSAESAGARLQAFRLAYGAGGRDTNVKPADVHKTFQSVLAIEQKVQQEWDGDATFTGMELEEGFCKLLLCTLMMTQEALPKGGVINVTYNADKNVTIVSGTGQDAHIRPQVDEALARSLSVDIIDPRLVHPYITGVLAAQYGYSVAIDEHLGNRISFIISK